MSTIINLHQRIKARNVEEELLHQHIAQQSQFSLNRPPKMDLSLKRENHLKLPSQQNLKVDLSNPSLTKNQLEWPALTPIKMVPSHVLGHQQTQKEKTLIMGSVSWQLILLDSHLSADVSHCASPRNQHARKVSKNQMMAV